MANAVAPPPNPASAGRPVQPGKLTGRRAQKTALSWPIPGKSVTSASERS